MNDRRNKRHFNRFFKNAVAAPERETTKKPASEYVKPDFSLPESWFKVNEPEPETSELPPEPAKAKPVLKPASPQPDGKRPALELNDVK